MGKKQEKQSQSEETAITGSDLEQHGKMMVQASLILATSQVAQPLVHGKNPKEAVDTFAEVYESMQDWYKGKPMKKQIQDMLDVLLVSQSIDQWDAEISK